MAILLLTIFFLFGLIIGSFLNVVIYRYNSSKTLGGRSACMSCKSKLAWYDMVPVFSYVFLAGRCRSCKSRISFQYPIVEFMTGIIFALIFWKLHYLVFFDSLSFAFTYAYYVVMFSLLLVVSVYDIKHKIIPDSFALVIALMAFGGMFLFSDMGLDPTVPPIKELFSGLLLALPFALIWLLSKGAWMGLGDAKLIVGLGYLLGLTRGLSAIIISFWIGALVGVLLLLLSKKGMKSELPFAPFLVLGSFLAFVFNLNIFYLGF